MVGVSMASSGPSGDDLMGGPRPRCTPAAPAPSGGYGPSGPPGVIWIFPPELHHLFSTICQPEIYRTDICWTDICRPEICPTDTCRPDELAAIALSFAAFDKREPERAEMGAERPISASTEKKKKKDLRSQSFRVCFLESQKLPQHLALLDQETESSSQLDTLQNSNWPVQLNRIQKRQKDCYKTL